MYVGPSARATQTCQFHAELRGKKPCCTPRRNGSNNSRMSKPLLICIGAAVLSLGCAGKPAAPFDALKTSNLTAYRLQNNEPPAPVAAVPGAPAIPGLDPNLQNQIT